MNFDPENSATWRMFAKQPSVPGQIKILCVEDNDGDFEILRANVSEMSSELRIVMDRAISSAEAGRMLSNHEEDPYDLVCLDLSLPDSHGLDSFDRLAESLAKLPVIVLSGNSDQNLAIEIVQRGAQDYLIKDLITPDSLQRSFLYSIERKNSLNTLAGLFKKLKATSDELKIAQLELIQTEKLDSLGRLAAGVAHEVRNPLGALRMGLSYLKQRETDLNDEGFAIVYEEMDNAIERADSIIQGMVDYSRDESLKLESIKANDLIDRAINLVHYDLIKKSIVIEKHLRSDLPSIHVDLTKMEQVLINLISNSIHAVGEGGKIEISTLWGRISDVDRDEGVREFQRLRKQDEVVIIEVRDFGPGIPEEKLVRVFEPFFTTKPTGEGTGLGLSVVKRIVELHRGHLQFQNARDGGTGIRARIILQAFPEKKITEPKL